MKRNYLTCCALAIGTLLLGSGCTMRFVKAQTDLDKAIRAASLNPDRTGGACSVVKIRNEEERRDEIRCKMTLAPNMPVVLPTTSTEMDRPDIMRVRLIGQEGPYTVKVEISAPTGFIINHKFIGSALDGTGFTEFRAVPDTYVSINVPAEQ